MRIDILSIFPGMFREPFATSMIQRAQDAGILEIGLTDLRTFTTDPHRSVDETPYGGGPGMVMRPGPLAAAIESLTDADPARSSHRILLTPQGVPLTQRHAQQLAQRAHLILICGRYEGVDERIRTAWVDEELSIGDYVLSGGEIPAMVVVDVLARLLPGVLGNAASLEEESHAQGLLEYPQYTRPADFRGHAVPEVLRSGNHEAIAQWRRNQAYHRTLDRRPDLIHKTESDTSSKEE